MINPTQLLLSIFIPFFFIKDKNLLFEKKNAKFVTFILLRMKAHTICPIYVNETCFTVLTYMNMFCFFTDDIILCMENHLNHKT